MNLILNTTAKLLDEVGVDAFNTNLLAQRAGLAVRSVYRYFPNKLAVIMALYERNDEDWERSLQELLSGLADPQRSAADAWESHIEDYVKFLEREGGWAVWRAVQTIPEFREIVRRDVERRADLIAVALRARDARGSEARLESVAFILIDSAMAALEEAWSRWGHMPTEAFDELKLMHRSYLANYVD